MSIGWSISSSQRKIFINTTLTCEKSSVIFLRRDRKGIFHGQTWSPMIGMDLTDGKGDIITGYLSAQKHFLTRTITIVDMIGKRVFSNSNAVARSIHDCFINLQGHIFHKIDTYSHYEEVLGMVFKKKPEPDSACVIL